MVAYWWRTAECRCLPCTPASNLNICCWYHYYGRPLPGMCFVVCLHFVRHVFDINGRISLEIVLFSLVDYVWRCQRSRRTVWTTAGRQTDIYSDLSFVNTVSRVLSRRIQFDVKVDKFTCQLYACVCCRTRLSKNWWLTLSTTLPAVSASRYTVPVNWEYCSWMKPTLS